MFGNRTSLLTLLGLTFIGWACQSPSEPEGPQLMDYSGVWTVSLLEGRLSDGTGDGWLDGVCALDGMQVTLAQGDTYLGMGLEAELHGSHTGGVLSCAGAAEGLLPAPFLEDTTVVVAAGSLEGKVGVGATCQFCFGPWVEGMPPFGRLELTNMDVIEASGDVRFHLLLSGGYVDGPAHAEGTFEVRAGRQFGQSSQGLTVMSGRWHGTR